MIYEGDEHIDIALQVLNNPQDVGGIDFALMTIEMYLWEASPTKKRAAIAAVLKLVEHPDPETAKQAILIAEDAPSDVLVEELKRLAPEQQAHLLAIATIKINLVLAGYAQDIAKMERWQKG